MKIMIGWILAMCLPAVAAAQVSVAWPGRQTKVVCGGRADGEDLRMRVVLQEGLIAAESKNERILAYIDLKREGRARVVIAEGMTDQEFEKREAILAKLSAEEAELIRAISAGRQSDFHFGFVDGFFHLDVATRNRSARSLSLSCSEVPGRQM